MPGGTAVDGGTGGERGHDGRDETQASLLEVKHTGWGTPDLAVPQADDVRWGGSGGDELTLAWGGDVQAEVDPA
ncbi:hypothetical protein DFR75_1242 [Nocardia ignorata]|uniref:Uncharacterized protein n=1 Tax=Nocardia ignorata TaxID=145285 RepID=A0A4R6NXE6_NOCIG|nr:hypothetical protein DFR75_1242 [Nocardia ignorata]